MFEETFVIQNVFVCFVIFSFSFFFLFFLQAVKCLLVMCSCVCCRSVGTLFQSYQQTHLAWKLSTALKTFIFILHPQFTLNLLSHISEAHIKLNVILKANRNVRMLTVHLCNHTKYHTHTDTLVGGKGNPLCVFFRFSYECVSDIQLRIQQRLVGLLDFPLSSPPLPDLLFDEK